MKKINLLVFALLAFSSLQSQSFNKQKMDSLFSLIESNNKGMGSVSVFQDGKEVYQRSIGYADVENKIKSNENTRYRIGSISKTFTATIIMQLVDEKKLSLGTKLSTFFPEIPNAAKITIEQMLRHHSGINNFTEDEKYRDWMEKPQTHEEMLKKIVKLGSGFEPGTKALYSNSNYVLLSYIAEKIEGKGFPEILNSRIVIPCRLQNTGYGGKIDTKKNEAKSYRKPKEWVPASETDMSIPAGAGAIASTPTDLNRFLLALFSGKLVSDSSLQNMEKIVDGFGIGIIKFPFYDKKTFGHTGGIDGFQAIAGYFPDDKVLVSYISNGVVMSRNDITIGILSIYFGNDYKLPEFKQPIVLKPEDLDLFPGIYSTPKLPMKLTVTKIENQLSAQATNQPSFLLEAIEKDKFVFEEGGIEIQFIPQDQKLILKQGGGVYEMKKE